jgi:hypothetical protein
MTDSTALLDRPAAQSEAQACVLVKTTLDGRAVEVIDGWVCLAGQRETDRLVALEEHPNRQAIQRAVPKATHMAGRLPLTLAEASVAQAALRRHQDRFDGSPQAVAERLRRAVWQKVTMDGAE